MFKFIWITSLLEIFINRLTVDISVWTFVLVFAAFLMAGLYQFIRKKLNMSEKEGHSDSMNDDAESLPDETDVENINNLESYKEIIEHTPDLIYRTDFDGVITYVNPAVTRLLGYEQTEILGRNFLELVDNEHRYKVELHVDRQLREQISEKYYEFESLTKDGQKVWLGQNTRLLKEGNNVVGIQAVARDISARLEAERKLKNREAQFRLFIKHTPAAVAMFDRDMNYIAVSDRWIEDFRIEEENVIGKSHYELFPEVPDDWKEIYQTCMTGISERSNEDRFTRRDGKTEWLHWEIHPWRDASGKVGGIIKFAELITERKETEEALKKAKEAAEEASRAKSNFMGRMSHEFRTPLTAILGFAEMLEDEDLTSDQMSHVQEITNSGRHLLSMVDDILNISEIESGKIEFTGTEFSISEILETYAGNMKKQLNQKNNEIKIWVDDQVPDMIVTDLEKFGQIVKNVLDNACKFMENGTITVKVTYNPVPGTGADGLLTLMIKDQGIGIPKGKIESIFRPFNQAEERYNQGTGLGLAVVKRLCRFLGGELKIDSEVGVGTNVFINIPVQVARLGLKSNVDQQNEEDTEDGPEPSAEEVSDFIKSLDKDTRELISEALELQNIDLLSTLDKHLDVPEDKRNGAIHKLMKSARSYDYLFVTEVFKHLKQ